MKYVVVILVFLLLRFVFSATRAMFCLLQRCYLSRDLQEAVKLLWWGRDQTSALMIDLLEQPTLSAVHDRYVHKLAIVEPALFEQRESCISI